MQITAPVSLLFIHSSTHFSRVEQIFAFNPEMAKHLGQKSSCHNLKPTLHKRQRFIYGLGKQAHYLDERVFVVIIGIIIMMVISITMSFEANGWGH